MATEAMVVLCTLPPGEPANRLARAVVEEQLAACVNLVPGVRSFYRWQGEIHDDAEQLAVIKTTRQHVDRLRERIVALHPYDCPEVIALPIEAGHQPYLDWIDEMTL